MGKKLISKYPSEIVKNSVKVKIKKHVNRAEKHENKRQLSSGQENEPPYKKTKIDDTTLKQCVVTNHDLSLDLDSRERVVKHGNYVYLQTTDCHMVDLFCVDELKNTYFQNIVRDFYWNLIEEISLEGLDGITLEGNSSNEPILFLIILNVDFLDNRKSKKIEHKALQVIKT